jgi:Nucleotide hydrolase
MFHLHSPILPEPFNANQPPTIRLYPVTNYTFGTKETQPEEDPSVLARLQRLEQHYEGHGMRRTCEGIMVCHEHNHPHVLMLQIANAFFKLYMSPFLSTPHMMLILADLVTISDRKTKRPMASKHA